MLNISENYFTSFFTAGDAFLTEALIPESFLTSEAADALLAEMSAGFAASAAIVPILKEPAIKPAANTDKNLLTPNS